MLGSFPLFCLDASGKFLRGLVLGSVIVAVIGGLAEMLLRPVYGKSMMYQMLVTIGLAFVLMDSMATIWGRDIKVIQIPEILSSAVSIMGVSFPTYRIFMIIVSIIFSIGLWLMFEKTKLGMTFRAIISNRTMVSNLGINVPFLFSIMFMFGIWLSVSPES